MARHRESKFTHQPVLLFWGEYRCDLRNIVFRDRFKSQIRGERRAQALEVGAASFKYATRVPVSIVSSAAFMNPDQAVECGRKPVLICWPSDREAVHLAGASKLVALIQIPSVAREHFLPQHRSRGPHGLRSHSPRLAETVSTPTARRTAQS